MNSALGVTWIGNRYMLIFLPRLDSLLYVYFLNNNVIILQLMLIYTASSAGDGRTTV